MNTTMDKICTWSNFNKLSINVDKTEIMLFTNRTIIHPAIKINNISIEYVSKFKYLGLHLDTKL